MIKPLKDFPDADFIIGSLRRYTEHKIPTGSFLRAVLENDLTEAIGRADHININRIPSIVDYIYNNLPHNSWGSKEIVRQFLEKGKENENDRHTNKSG